VTEHTYPRINGWGRRFTVGRVLVLNSSTTHRAYRPKGEKEEEEETEEEEIQGGAAS